jgi:hypothetical protein
LPLIFFFVFGKVEDKDGEKRGEKTKKYKERKKKQMERQKKLWIHVA